MRQISIIFIILLIFINPGNAGDVSTVARELAEFFPCFHPDSVTIIVKAKSFDLSATEFLQNLQQQMGKDFSQLPLMEPKQLEQFLQRNINFQIEKKLVRLTAEQKGIIISPLQVDSVLHNLNNDVEHKGNFLAILASNDIDIDFLRNDIEYNLYRDKLLHEHIYSQYQPNEDEITAYYKRDILATARHILLKTDDFDESGKKLAYSRLDSLREEIIAGADFAELARTWSEDPGSREQGGLIANFKRGQMVGEFDQTAFSIPIGETSPIITTEFGYHIIQVISRKSEEKPLEIVREKIIRDIENDYHQQEYQQFLQQSKKKQDITILFCNIHKR